jgi:hypothetical protein
VRRWHGGVAIAWLACVAPPLAGQATPLLDAGVSGVHYDGFLSTTSAYLAPGFRFNRPHLTIAVQGSYLLFESGNSVLQGTGAAAWLSPHLGPLQAELGGFWGVSKYSAAPTAGYALGRARAHLNGRWHGLWLGSWVGGAYGRSSAAATWYDVGELAGGAWIAGRRMSATGAVTWSSAADSGYVDITGAVRWSPWVVELDGLLGVRTWSQGGGTGTYGQVDLRIALDRRLALLIGGGRTPSDYVRGILASKYVTVGLRVVPFPGPVRPAAALTDVLRREARPPEVTPAATAPLLALASDDGELRTLRVRAPGAQTVEIAADFTDWQPLPLLRVSGDAWEITLRIPPGSYRIDVRANGGRWLAPRGTRLEHDEFGSEVGILVVW